MTGRDELLHAIDRLADAATSRDPGRVEARRRDAKALVVLLVKDAPARDWLDRCWRCDRELAHSLLNDDGLCASCAEGQQ